MTECECCEVDEYYRYVPPDAAVHGYTPAQLDTCARCGHKRLQHKTQGTGLRELTKHRINDVNRRIRIFPREHSTGDVFRYVIEVMDKPDDDGSQLVNWSVELDFQQGTLAEANANGITVEVLLAIAIDKLESFQRGKWPNPHNDVALARCYDALLILQQRVEELTKRGLQP